MRSVAFSFRPIRILIAACERRATRRFTCEASATGCATRAGLPSTGTWAANHGVAESLRYLGECWNRSFVGYDTRGMASAIWQEGATRRRATRPVGCSPPHMAGRWHAPVRDPPGGMFTPA